MVDIENTRNFCFLVEICGGVMEAYDAKGLAVLKL